MALHGFYRNKTIAGWMKKFSYYMITIRAFTASEKKSGIFERTRRRRRIKIHEKAAVKIRTLYDES